MHKRVFKSKRELFFFKRQKKFKRMPLKQKMLPKKYLINYYLLFKLNAN